MPTESNDEPNPYQSPLADLAPPAPEDEPARLRTVLKRFRRQSVELAVFWIIVGVVAIGTGMVLLSSVELPPVWGMALMASAPVWMFLGGMSWAKYMWALRAGLLCSYVILLVALCLAVVVPCLTASVLLIMIVAVAQAHRVLRWAKMLNQAGIPLTARPHDIPVFAEPTSR